MCFFASWAALRKSFQRVRLTFAFIGDPCQISQPSSLVATSSAFLLAMNVLVTTCQLCRNFTKIDLVQMVDVPADLHSPTHMEIQSQNGNHVLRCLWKTSRCHHRCCWVLSDSVTIALASSQRWCHNRFWGVHSDIVRIDFGEFIAMVPQ